MAYTIQTGVWTDWTKGSVLGATITLSSRDAGLLLAFTAAFVTVIAARLWRILGFVFHQYLVSDGPHDGLYYQRQHIFRNAATPAGAIWIFILQAWYWRGITQWALLRTLPWAALGGLYVVLFALLAVFSSQISEGASEFRLIKSSTCGFFDPEGDLVHNNFHDKSAYDNLHAAIYSRQCYQNLSTTACQELPTPSIRWTNESVDCPFGSRICLDVPSFRMESDMIDSHVHLGINEPESNRIGYKRQATCAPLVTQPGFAQYVRGDEADRLGVKDDALIRYFYGNQGNTTSWTFTYNTNGRYMGIGYSSWVYYSLAGMNDTFWRPVDELNQDDGDLSLFLIAPNSIIHAASNKDPVFEANIYEDFNITGGFRPDRWLSSIACIHRHQICNPKTEVCTPFQGVRELAQSVETISLNPTQMAIANRLRFNIGASTFYDVVWTRTQNFLKAQEGVAGLRQLPLPSNQWEIEMSSLFADSLAKLQYQVHEFAAGPSMPTNITLRKFWELPEYGPEYENKEFVSAYGEMCHKQRVRMTQGTLNFSVLWLSILIGLGSFVIVLSFVLENIVVFIQAKTAKGSLRAKRWENDESLQVMRGLFEAKGAGVWASAKGQFPRTENGEKFNAPI